MYQFYGIIDWSFQQHEADHRQSIATIRKKFPGRSAGFELIQRDHLVLFGTHIKIAKVDAVELFFTGEIYNESEIQKRAGNQGTIATCLLQLYLNHGESALSGINGTFIIVLLDSASRTCRIINDQMGTMQVVYHDNRDFTLFGSELKYLFCHARCPRAIDWEAALKRPIPFLVVNSERHYDAWFKDIKLLEEGCILEIQNSGSHSVKPYWDPWLQNTTSNNGTPHESNLTADGYVEAYMQILDDAVRLRCSSNGNAFAMFSGGMDSSVIAALARQHCDVKTFSFATPATVRDGATEMCLRLAGDLGVTNTQVVLPFDELVTDGKLWLQHIWSMESPIAHKDAIGKFALHAAISQVQPDARSIMSGTGSDQLNGGLVRWFIENADDESLENNWDRVMEEINTEMLKPVIGHQYDTFWGSRDLLSIDFLATRSRSTISDYPWPDFVRGCLHANHYVLDWDELRAGAWHHRNVSFPFLDHRFVPFILGIPRELHPQLFFDKQILRQGAQNLLPSYLTNKPKAPVKKPGEDKRTNMYKEILSGNDGFVMDILLDAMRSGKVPVDPVKFERKARHLMEEPNQAGYAYLMHIAGLVALDQLPDQDESDLDMTQRVMSRVEIIPSNTASAMDTIRKQLSVLSEDEVLNQPLCFAPDCSLVSDVFSGTYFVVKDNEMVYQLEDDQPEWRIFLNSIDNKRSAAVICKEKGLDIKNFHAFFRISLEEGILLIRHEPVHHEEA